MRNLLFILLVIAPVFSQSTSTDTTRTTENNLFMAEYNPLFPEKPELPKFSLKINSKYLEFRNDPTDFFVRSYLASEEAVLDSSELRKIEFKQIGKNINTSILTMYNIKARRDPTLLRQILGTVGTAAAFGLAGYHVYKYYVKKEN